MLRGSLLAAALFALLGFGSGAGHVRNGRIAYVHVGSGDRFQIYTVTATGAHRRPLTNSRKYSSFAPAYAPGGKRIVFVRSFKQFDLWTMSAQGRGLKRLTSTPGEYEASPAWSPDGKEIAFGVGKPAAKRGIWVVARDGGAPLQLTSGGDDDPTWSPDGGKIAFSRADAIYVVPVSGGGPTQLTFPGVDSDGQAYFDAEPAWSPNGKGILFVSDRGDPAESGQQLDLWTVRPDGSGLARITRTPSRDERDPAWSPDGRRIVYSGNGTFHGASSSQLYVSNANGTQRRKITHACGECAFINDEPSWQPLR